MNPMVSKGETNLQLALALRTSKIDMDPDHVCSPAIALQAWALLQQGPFSSAGVFEGAPSTSPHA